MRGALHDENLNNDWNEIPEKINLSLIILAGVV